MTPRAHLICGDVFDVLGKLPAGYFDAIFNDPPYGLGFMNRAFDLQHKLKPGANDGQRLQAWNRDWLDLSRPLLKPGGWIVSAAASKLYHRLACPAEDAGFVLLPLFAWINGSAMSQGGALDKLIDKAAGAEREVVGVESKMYPDGGAWGGQKAHSNIDGFQAIYGGYDPQGGLRTITAPATDLAQRFYGYSTRLKDAVTPWLVAHRAIDGTWAQNAARHGLGGLNVEAGRVPTDGRPAREQYGSGVKHLSYGARAEGGRATGTTTQGRYPPNVCLDEAAALEIGRQSAAAGAHSAGAKSDGIYRAGESLIYGDSRPGQSFRHGDAARGSDASRFFHQFRYQAKAGSAERLRGAEGHYWRVSKSNPLGFERISFEEWRGMEHLPGCRGRAQKISPLAFAQDEWTATQRDTGCLPDCQERQRYRGNITPCLKPLELCTYLARLILPPPRDTPRRLLIPFSGTGSEAIGALLAGWDEVWLVEDEAVYCDLAAARIAVWGPYSAGRANQIAVAGKIDSPEEAQELADFEALSRGEALPVRQAKTITGPLFDA